MEEKTPSRQLGPFAVNPVGFGAMRLAGPGVFGPPADPAAAIRLLHEAIGSGVNHIDTAEYYGPVVVNELIREALYPYPSDLVLVSKVGARRDERGGIFSYDDAPDLRRGIEDNLRTLKVDTLPVVNLRLMGGSAQPDSKFDDQLAAMVQARDDGLIRAVGLSNVTLAHLQHALTLTEIACVQNAYHLADRRSQPVLDECIRRDIAFVPFAPLGTGATSSNSVLGAPQVVLVAAKIGCSPAQVALAWALNVAPNVLLIPGTSSQQHFRENQAAGLIQLDDADARALSTVR